MSDNADGKRTLDLGNFAFSFSAPAATPAPAFKLGAPANPSWFVIENFLPEALADQILADFIAHEADFIPSLTVGMVDDYRQALEIPPRLPVFRLFEMRLHLILSEVIRRLGLSDVPLRMVDMGGNAYPTGGLFKKHYDNAAAVNASRVISYVYYLHKRPKAFHGGELVIHPRKRDVLVREPQAVVPPTHNSIVFFHSDYLHEVLPVVVPSGRFADSRFTINGWVHK